MLRKTKSEPAKTTEDDPEGKKSLRQIIVDEVKFIIGLAAFLMLFFNFVFGHFKIPSESMQPTLEVGDHLYVNKFAYGFSRHSLIFNMHKLPFLNDGRVFARQPQRGDVVVFRNPKAPNLVMIKRLVGMPGDTVQTERGRLIVNGEMIERKQQDIFEYREHRGGIAEVVEYEEQIPDEKDPHGIYERNDIYPLDNAGPFTIPDGKYFFMGDNRDNSQDSRAPLGPGFVPFDNLIGRAEMMVYSLKRCKTEEGLRCPGVRFFKKL
jgi:signal peptidase I